MSCQVAGALTVCGGGSKVTYVDREHGEPRWCFRCRKVRAFRFTVIGDAEPSYYEPNPYVRCAVCNLDDGDMGFGRYRIWGEE